MENNTSSRFMIGFVVSWMLQVTVGISVMIARTVPNADGWTLFGATYAITTLLGAVYLHQFEHSFRLVGYRHVVYVFLGILTPLVGVLFLIYVGAMFTFNLVTLRYFKILYRYLLSRD